MPLFRVKSVRKLVVYAADEVEAEKIALQHDSEEDPYIENITEILSETQLPPPWTPNCVPYGGDEETTIAGHLKKK